MSTDIRREKPPLGSLIKPRMADKGGYYFQCCDCALTHRLDFVVTEENGLELRVHAAPEETAKFRAAKNAEADEGWLDADPAVTS